MGGIGIRIREETETEQLGSARGYSLVLKSISISLFYFVTFFQSDSTIEIAPHCSQKLHIVRWPLSPEAHATRSFGICEQPVLEGRVRKARQLIVSNNSTAGISMKPTRGGGNHWTAEADPNGGRVTGSRNVSSYEN